MTEKYLLTSIHHAVLKNDVMQVNRLIQTLDDRGRKTWIYGKGSPLHSAAGFEKVDIVKVLLSSGFDANAYLEKHQDRITSLMWACIHNRPMSVKTLLANGADPALEGSWNGMYGTALDFAKRSKNDDIIHCIESHATGLHTPAVNQTNSAASKTSKTPTTPGLPAVIPKKPKGKAVSAKTTYASVATGAVTEAGTSENTVGPNNSLSGDGDGDDSLVRDLQELIRRKIGERERSIVKAEVTHNLITKHEEEINRLKGSPDFKTKGEIEAMRKEVKDLHSKLSKVHQLVNSVH